MTSQLHYSITIGPVNQANFAQGSGNKSGSTTASATLKANTGNNSATNTYNVYLRINSNTFQYTTSNNTAELVLKVTNPAGNTQTISNLTSVTSGGVTGYDITTKQGLIPIASNYQITTTSTKTDTWTAQVYFINLNSDQQVNSAKTFTAEVVIEKREPITVTFDANGGSVSQTSKQVTYGTYYDTLPTPTKSGATFLGWNGKNKFNEEDYDTTNVYTLGSGYKIAPIQLKPNTTYITSVVRYNGFAGTLIYYLINNNVESFSYGSWNSVAHDTYPNRFLPLTTSDDGLLYIGYTQSANQSILDTVWQNTDVQIEEGSTSTLYEPYYVTSNVVVTQESDHTLTAIWQ